LQLAEEFQAAPPGNARAGQVLHAGSVRAGLLRARETQEIAHRGLLAQRHHAHPGLARAGQHGGNARQRGQQRDASGLANAFVDADHVAARDVAQFVRQHALHLIGGIGRLDQPCMDVDPLPAGNEGVDRIVVDQHHLDRAGIHPRGFH